MGPPEFEPANIPFLADSPGLPFMGSKPAARVSAVSALSMGNPHCVLQVDRVAEADVSTIGPLIETHERFPNGANVGFMAIRNRGQN